MLHKGGLVRISGDPARSIGVIIKGPYETSFSGFGRVNVTIVYDVYCDSKILYCIPSSALEPVGSEEEASES